MPDTYLSVMPRPRPRPDSAALAAAWGKRANPDSRNWARRQVEKIRAAWGAGRLQLPPWIDNYTDETPEIREAYHGLLSEPMVKAGYGSKVWAVAALDCNVVPADPDDARHKQAATAFKWVLSQVGMGSKNGRPVGTQLIAWEVLSGACINGWSLCELVGGDVARRGPAAGKEYWRDIKAKDTRRLSPIVDEFKNVVAIRSWLAGARTWEGVDLDSFVTYAHWPLYCSPNGMSDFRAVYRAACIKNVAMRLRALGLDRWTHPYLKATAATDEQKEALKEALEDARGDGFVVLPPGALVDAVQLATSSDDVFHNAIQDLDREILIGISWSHLPMQEGQTTGGRGDTEVQQGTAELGQWALASVLGGVVTGQMARPWYERNYGDIEPGTVVWGAVNEKALLTSAQLDEALLKIGVKLSRKERQNYYGRAAPADDGDSLAPPGRGPPPGGPPPPAGPPGLPFGEDFDAFCTEGKNAGKPGPCPGGGAGDAASGRFPPDAKAVALDAVALNKPDPRTMLPPTIPALYDRLKEKHPALTEPAFHALLHKLEAEGLATLQRFNVGPGVDLEGSTGYPAHRFPVLTGRGGRYGPAGWVQFAPGAVRELAALKLAEAGTPAAPFAPTPPPGWDEG